MLRLWNSSVYARVFLGDAELSVCLIQGKLKPKVTHKTNFNIRSGRLLEGLALLKEWLIKNNFKLYEQKINVIE